VAKRNIKIVDLLFGLKIDYNQELQTEFIR